MSVRAGGRRMKLLAIDESSTSTGLALFLGEQVQWTRRLAPLRDWPWRRRMRWITEMLREVLAVQELADNPPDVVAIEDAVVSRKNPMMGVTVGECRGWMIAHLDSLWPDVRIMTIAPAKVRAAVGISAFARRARSKDRYRVVAEYLGLPPTASEDEADAVCVGMAAIAQLRVEGWEAMAG